MTLDELRQFNKEGMGGLAKNFNYSGNHPPKQTETKQEITVTVSTK